MATVGGINQNGIVTFDEILPPAPCGNGIDLYRD